MNEIKKPVSPFVRRADEPEHAHRAFLLWAMQSVEKRSLKAASRAMNKPDMTIRKWRKRHDWDLRIEGEPNHEIIAARLYSDCYHRINGGKEVRLVMQNMAVRYEGNIEPPEEEKTEVAKAVDLYEEIEKENQRKDSKDRLRRLNLVLDGTLARIAKAIAEGDLKPQLRDLGNVIRGYAMAESSELRQLSMLPGGERGKDTVADSQRVLLARQRGGDVFQAMREDAEELLLIIRTMEMASDMSNVLPFEPKRGGSRKKNEDGEDEDAEEG